MEFQLRLVSFPDIARNIARPLGGREKGKQAGMGGTKWEMDRVSMEELAFMEEEGKRKEREGGRKGEVSKGGSEGIDRDRKQSANKREKK